MSAPDTDAPKVIDTSLLRERIAGSALEALEPFTREAFVRGINHGDLPRWQSLIASLPAQPARDVDLSPDTVRIGAAGELAEDEQRRLREVLEHFIPWRKGPFSVFGVDIDTEWRADWKWQRLQGHMAPLAGRKVLDVGCGNGYHCFRMLGEEASLVLGVDPHLAYVMQFWLLRRFLPEAPAFVLPTGLEHLPLPLPAFDTVFSMGVLYHRRSPFDHLLQLKDCLRSGGELVLETLVVEGGEGHTLTPRKRYCRMGNVWFVPSCATTEKWLERCGFRNIRTIDVTPTGPEEQRATAWMPFQSLEDGLQAQDPSLTIEGLPAPVRAIIVAEKP